MKYILLIALLGCRAPDRYYIGVSQSDGGSHTTSAGPKGGRTTADAEGGAAISFGVSGGIGKSETEKQLERIADAQERESFVRADEALKERDRQILAKSSDDLPMQPAPFSLAILVPYLPGIILGIAAMIFGKPKETA